MLCKTDWTNNKNFVGERVITSTTAPGKRHNGMGAKKNRAVAIEATEEEENPDGADQEHNDMGR